MEDKKQNNKNQDQPTLEEIKSKEQKDLKKQGKKLDSKREKLDRKYKKYM